MKLFIIMLSLGSLLVTKSVKAGDEKVSPVIANAFQRSFNNVKEVKWSEANGLYKAEFVYNNQYMTSYFNGDGELIANSKHISSESLPSRLQASLKKYMDQYWISDLFSVSTEEGTVYYVTLKSGDEEVMLQSVADKKWTSYKKIVKL
jgi:Protein of unknown function (DUF2874).